MRRILLSNIEKNMKLGKPIFLADGTVLFRAGIELTKPILEQLRSLYITYLYVEDEMTQDITIDDIVNEKIRLEAVFEIKKMMQQFQENKLFNLSEVKRIAALLIDELRVNQNKIIHFIDMRTKEDYLFCHSVNVCILSILTGFSLGFTKEILTELAIGALLHDIGKLKVNLNILQKKGRLTLEERKEMCDHAQFGFEILQQYSNLSTQIACCALQHHERYNGTGYPQQLRGQQIDLLAQIIGLADLYDALTSDHFYRQAIPVSEALAIIEKSSGTSFKSSIVTAFMKPMTAFPIGSAVRLNSHQVGIVVDMSREAKEKPVVRIISDENHKPLNNMLELDLSKQPRLYIVDSYER